MKVLAIRGANLASLEGEFELDLADGPLARAGVFAICGPTGAGKSTLLDAMCLALFDDAPRLSGRVRVGRADEDEGDRLTTSDPRTILRKGAGSGFAEVDFLGVDGRRYRARWEVRRARGRARGKLQPTVMSVRDLEDDQPLGGGRKTDVLEAVEARLGLTFDQFRRSVLLAQNDFAAFLDADAKERAGLLERMTGTEIYGVISMEAHARAGEERRVLEVLDERARRIVVLSEPERAEHEGRLAELERQVLEDEVRARDAERAVEWHAQLDGLLREETEAREEHQHTVRQLALAESRRAELEAYEAARPLRPLLEGADRAATLAAARGRHLAELERERTARAEAVGEAERAERRERDALRVAEAARLEAGPALAQARRLDGELLAEGERVREREARAHRLGAQLAQLTERQAALESRLAEHVQRAERAGAWLAEHAGVEPVAEAWPRHEQRLERLVELAEELRCVEAETAAARTRRDDARARYAERAGAADAATRAHAQAEAAYREADAARQAPSEALAEVRSRWVERRSALDTMLGVAELAQRASQAEHRQRDTAERAAAAAARARREAEAAERDRERTATQLEEAQRARDALRSTLDLASRRSELRDGEPCPLCGALDHPFAHELPLVESLLGAQDARVRTLTSELTGIDRRVAEARGAAEANGEAQREAEREAAHCGDELAQARARYHDAAVGLGADEASWPRELPSAPRPRADWGPLFAMAGGEADGPLLETSALDALRAARAAAVEALAQLEVDDRARRQAERAAETRRAALDAARAHAEVTTRAAEAAADARDAEEREGERLERSRADAAARLGHAVDTLLDVLGLVEVEGASPRARLESAPDAVLTEVRRDVEAWLARSDERARAEAEARAAAPAAAAVRDQREAAALQHEAGQSELDQARGALARATAARASLFGGADADAHELGLDEALASARASASGAADALAAARLAVAEHAARERSAREALAQAQGEADHASERMVSACAAAGVAEADARARLSRDPVELESWRRELAALDAARQRQAAVLAERVRRREAHAEREPPAVGPEEARKAMTEARQRVASSRDLLSSTRARLARDDEQRAEQVAFGLELSSARERLSVWEALSDLIGSASGAKLRVFAQSLTLELLLEHANHHLQSLAPRYALARVPHEDLALMVIDREMGEEVRGVGSLSGGESFLVALGMALGLASLSSNRAQVGSLFIDEGFGALDPESLDVVLGALDALQASGRQIGVISHVQTMAERFDTRVQVVAAGPARSRVELVEGFA